MQKLLYTIHYVLPFHPLLLSSYSYQKPFHLKFESTNHLLRYLNISNKPNYSYLLQMKLATIFALYVCCDSRGRRNRWEVFTLTGQLHLDKRMVGLLGCKVIEWWDYINNFFRSAGDFTILHALD